jgi:dipeptidyl aminopeptidase/acylaminoacyl peptidase
MLSAMLLAKWTVEALLGLTQIQDPQIRPAGEMYSYVQNGEILLSPLRGGEARHIHKGRRPRWSPDSNRLAFITRADGTDQIFIYEMASGSLHQFTHAKASTGFYSWAPDGRAIAFLAADPGPSPDPIVSGQHSNFSRLYWQAMDAAAARQITSGTAHVASFAISPSGDTAVYAAHPSPANEDSLQSDLYTVDLKTLAVRPLVVQPGRDGEPSWSPDGKWIAFHSQGGTNNYFEKRDVAVIPSAGGPIRYITRGHPEDVFRNGNAFTWTPDSGALIYTAGKGIEDVLVRHDIGSGVATTLAGHIAGAASFTSDLSQAVFLQVNADHPPEVMLLKGTSLRQLTHVQDAVSAFPRFSSEVVKWKSRDGLPVEGMLWLPVGYRTGTRVPLLTELHGGPTGVVLDAFPTPRTYPIQVFLEKGIAVFAPNFRGSVNYGAEFRLRNALSQGEGDYDDVMTGIDSLIARGIADPDRLGVMGWSYGGYLTTSIVTKTNRFKAASIGAPATDWITYYGQSDGPKEVLWTYFGGTPWDVPDNYSRHSPRSRLKDVRTPCLLQVGLLDINHNAEIYRALTDNHVEAAYVVYPREYHSISEPAHVRDVMERNERWFLHWLLASK